MIHFVHWTTSCLESDGQTPDKRHASGNLCFLADCKMQLSGLITAGSAVKLRPLISKSDGPNGS